MGSIWSDYDKKIHTIVQWISDPIESILIHLNPADTRRKNNVTMTSKRRRDTLYHDSENCESETCPR